MACGYCSLHNFGLETKTLVWGKDINHNLFVNSIFTDSTQKVLGISYVLGGWRSSPQLLEAWWQFAIILVEFLLKMCNSLINLKTHNFDDLPQRCLSFIHNYRRTRECPLEFGNTTWCISNVWLWLWREGWRLMQTPLNWEENDLICRRKRTERILIDIHSPNQVTPWDLIPTK